MTRYYYDLHLHSCLSPCADDDMTPANLAGMAALNGLQLVALTDHNSCGNCEAFLKACRAYGLVGVPGMELTTAEEIHLVCLFPTLEKALTFERLIKASRLLVKNRPEIFGRQLFVNVEDEIVGEEDTLLIPATTIDLTEAYGLADACGGVAYPAHIDRDANGIVAILGTVPTQPCFTAVELRDEVNREAYTEKHGLQNKLFVYSSDAHHLWDVQMAKPYFELDDDPYSSARVRQALIDFLRRRP